jgi:hypothetical protein
MTGKRTTG